MGAQLNPGDSDELRCQAPARRDRIGNHNLCPKQLQRRLIENRHPGRALVEFGAGIRVVELARRKARQLHRFNAGRAGSLKPPGTGQQDGIVACSQKTQA